MNIMVINATPRKGSTYQMKELFLEILGNEHDVSEYTLPDAFPAFCTNCRSCVCDGLNSCPHAKYTVPLWEAIIASDLIILILPSYATEIPKQLQELLNHYYARFMADSAEAKMISKQAVVISREIGQQPLNEVVQSIKESLDEWGITQIHVIKQHSFKIKCERLAAKIELINLLN